jgi:hypothetical protein
MKKSCKNRLQFPLYFCNRPEDEALTVVVYRELYKRNVSEAK